MNRQPAPVTRQQADTARSMTPADYSRARRLLMRRDAVLGAVIAKHGPCGLADGQREHGLQAMITHRISVSQEVKVTKPYI